jgi:hypothetical protein
MIKCACHGLCWEGIVLDMDYVILYSGLYLKDLCCDRHWCSVVVFMIILIHDSSVCVCVCVRVCVCVCVCVCMCCLYVCVCVCTCVCVC